MLQTGVNLPYPETRSERDQWIVSRRPNLDAARAVLPTNRASHWLRESEPDAKGNSAEILTVFLTNRECPWRCLMCDLWQHTTNETVNAGGVAAQVAGACKAARAEGDGEPIQWLKLYNAGSFFDARAIPPEDHPTIAAEARAFQRLIVECHPSLVNERCLRFRDQLGATRLEVAMGLETAHPEVLEKLNKRMTLADFARATGFLRREGIEVRVFVLVKPPFLDDSQAAEWACRSIDFAFDCGADVVSLIPTRSGNGALNELAREGLFSPPRLETLEAVTEYGVGLGRGRVFADLWDLERLAADKETLALSRGRLERINLEQRVVD